MKKYFYGICFILMGCIIINAQSDDFVTIAGIVKSYRSKTEACFFVDKDMVQQGITIGFGNKAGKICTDPKYGQGVPINFDGLNTDGDYPEPPDQDVIVEVRGMWVISDFGTNGKTSIFHATEWEPFF